MYKKVFELFLTLPLESLTIKQIVDFTNSDINTVTAIVMELKVQNDIYGINKFKLSKHHIKQHIKDIK